MAEARLVAISVAISIALTALLVPFIQSVLDQETLTTLRSAPIAGHALNASLLAVQTLGALLSGDSSPAGPSLRDHYPREALEDLPWPGAPPLSLPQRDEDLDWAHPTVWRAQRTARNGMPYYTAEDVDRLLYWCREGGGSGDSSSGAGTGDGEGGGGGAEGAEAGEGDGGDGGGLAGGLYGKLVKWIEDAGGDVAGVEPYVDERGMRGLRATRDVPEGGLVLGLPVQLGLSVATFQGAPAAPGATRPWRDIEDWDLHLDTLALAYEVAVRRERSAWAAYLCSMPRGAPWLPAHASDPRDAALVSELPEVRRLAAKRTAQWALFQDAARAALAVMPGGRAALARLDSAAGPYVPPAAAAAHLGNRTAAPGGNGSSSSGGSSGNSGNKGGSLWPALWQWSSAMARTRAVGVDMEYVAIMTGGSGAGAGISGAMQTGVPRAGGGGDGGGRQSAAAAAAGGGQGAPLRLSPSLQEAVGEVGVLFPVLDLANHGFSGEGANCRFKLVPGPRGGLLAGLVAVRHVARGSPALFDYVEAPEAEDGPACAERWLVEYGFVPPTSSPHRDCESLQITPEAVAAVLLKRLQQAQKQESKDEDIIKDDSIGGSEGGVLDSGLVDRLAKGIKVKLVNESKLVHHVVRIRLPYDHEVAAGHQAHVQGRWLAVEWLSIAIEGAREAWEEVRAPGGEGAGLGEWRAMDVNDVLVRLMKGRRRELRELVRRAGEAGGELAGGVAGVAAGALRAVERALEREKGRR